MKNDLKIHFLNTIWSDAIMLESEKHYAFVDTASAFYYPMIKDYINMYKIKELDFILLTHFHSDHYGNIVNIINDFNVKKLYLKHYSAKEGDTGSGCPTNEEYLAQEIQHYNDIISCAKEHNVEIIYLDEIDKAEPYIINFYDNELELYNLSSNLDPIYYDESSPYYMKHMFSENNNSIVIYACINNHKIFLGADLTESDTEEKSLYRLSEKYLKEIYQIHNISSIDVYKSCHHGGSGTNKIELAKLLNAKYMIITNTDRWLDKWPTIQNFKDAREDTVFLKTDYFQYVFDFSNKEIKYESIPLTSLFISLNKD